MNSVLSILRQPLTALAVVVAWSSMAALAIEATDVADGFTSSVPTRAKAKFGARRTLDVANNQTAYVQFELDALVPDVKPGDIRKATLRLWVGKVGKPGTLRISATGDGTTLLDETTIANATAPAPGAALGTFAVSKDDTNTFVTIDVTPVVTALALSPASRPAFIIAQSVPDDGTAVCFDSKENIATGHYPQLQLLVGDSDASAYGDGSAGALVINDPNVIIEPLDAQFTDLTISAGATVFVQSGTIIRCSGTFTNHGTLTVAPAAKGGSAASAGFAGAGSHPGLSLRPAGNGFEVAAPNQAFGGVKGLGFGQFGARALIAPGVFGGGAGGGASNVGGAGGGTLVLRVAGAIDNSGSIFAKGDNGSSQGDGGGGGGVVVLASRTSIVQSGTVDCSGGTGANGDTVNAAGGGGGGGVVMMVSPVVTDSGTLTISGGAGGTSVQITATTRRSGGGGGGSAGEGGPGGMVNTGLPATATNGDPGMAGRLVKKLIDPTSLLH